jgi:hypothetical protein
MARVESTIWAYAWDIQDEGVSTALSNMQDRGGLTGVNIATAYHSGKFLHVHNPKRRVVFPQPGALYFSPDESWYGKLRIEPPIWDGASISFWRDVRDEASRRGMTLTAWTLSLHNSMIGFAYPDCAVENAYGDKLAPNLCPNHPDIRAYQVALVRDIAAHLEPDRILLEALEYMPFQHGYHHEVNGVPLPAGVDFLMSLCFCENCASAATAKGISFDGIRTWVRDTLDQHFADPFTSPVELDWDALKVTLDGEFQEFLDMRCEALVSLLREMVENVRGVSSCKMAVLDFGPLFPLGPDGKRWQSGFDLSEYLSLVDETHPTFYFTDLDVHRAKIAEYTGMLDGQKPMHAAVRAILPQIESPQQLKDQLEPLGPHVEGVSFYNYGFMALPVLDWISEGMNAIIEGKRHG